MCHIKDKTISNYQNNVLVQNIYLISDCCRIRFINTIRFRYKSLVIHAYKISKKKREEPTAQNRQVGDWQIVLSDLPLFKSLKTDIFTYNIKSVNFGSIQRYTIRKEFIMFNNLYACTSRFVLFLHSIHRHSQTLLPLK